MQLPQHVVRDVAAGAGLAVQEDRDLGIAEADLLDEGAQLGDGLLLLVGQFLVVHRQDEGGGPRLLLGEGSHVAIAGHPQHLHALLFQGLGQCPDAEARGVLGTEVLVDDDDWKVETHGHASVGPPQGGMRPPVGGSERM